MQGFYNQPIGIGYPSYYTDANGIIKYFNRNNTFNKESKDPEKSDADQNNFSYCPRQPSDFCNTTKLTNSGSAQQYNNNNNNQTCTTDQNQNYYQIDKVATNNILNYYNSPNSSLGQYPQYQPYSQIDKDNTNNQMGYNYNNIPTSYQPYTQIDKDNTNNQTGYNYNNNPTSYQPYTQIYKDNTNDQMGYNNSPTISSDQYTQNQQYAEIKNDNTNIEQPQNVYNLSSTKDPQQLANQSNYYPEYNQQTRFSNIGSANYNYSYKPEFNQQNESDKMEEPNQKYGSNNYSNNFQYVQQNQLYYGNQYQSKCYVGEQIYQQPKAINRNFNANENILQSISENSNFSRNEIEISSIEYPSVSNDAQNSFLNDNLKSTNIQPRSIERKIRSLNETLQAANAQRCSFDGKRCCSKETFEQLYQNIPLCKTCAEIIQKHFYVNKDIDELKELVADSSIQKVDKSNINEEPSKLQSPVASTSKVSIHKLSDISVVDQPENVISSDNVESDKEDVIPVGDTDSTIYEGHPSRRDRPSVQSFVEDVCSHCGGWTLVKEDSADAEKSSNLPEV